MELSKEQEQHIWELKNIKHPTKEQMEGEDYGFLKKLYWDLELHFLKKLELDKVQFLQNSWKDIEKSYLHP